MKSRLPFYVFFLISYIGVSQNTHIPDYNFEQALIDLVIDSDGVINNSVLTSDISGVTTLAVNNRGINDLTGIEDFISLTSLTCYSNPLGSLDISQNTALEFVF